MLLYEAEGKRLLQQAGFSIPAGQIAKDAAGALDAAQAVGFPCVLKAQMLAGGRAKRGFVRVVQNETELQVQVADMHARQPDSEPIAGFLLEQYIAYRAECYVAVTIAEGSGTAVVLISDRGGVDVENEMAQKRVMRFEIAARRSPWPFEIADFLKAAGIEPRLCAVLAPVAARLARFAIAHQAIMAEINPLLVSDDFEAVAADAKIELDDASASVEYAAIFPRELHPIESDATSHGFTFARLDGDIGTIVGGAGLAMLTIDALHDQGLLPANFIDLQGSSTKKFVAAFDLIAKLGPLRGVITNNAGGLNPCLSLAEGIMLGARRLSSTLPIVVKLHGADEAASWQFLKSEAPHIHIAKGTTADAVRLLRSVL